MTPGPVAVRDDAGKRHAIPERVLSLLEIPRIYSGGGKANADLAGPGIGIGHLPDHEHVAGRALSVTVADAPTASNSDSVIFTTCANMVGTVNRARIPDATRSGVVDSFNGYIRFNEELATQFIRLSGSVRPPPPRAPGRPGTRCVLGLSAGTASGPGVLYDCVRAVNNHDGRASTAVPGVADTRPIRGRQLPVSTSKSGAVVISPVGSRRFLVHPVTAMSERVKIAAAIAFMFEPSAAARMARTVQVSSPSKSSRSSGSFVIASCPSDKHGHWSRGRSS